MNMIRVGNGLNQSTDSAALGIIKSAAIMLALLICAASNGSAQANQVALQSVDGEAVNLSNDRGKVVVLIFSATWVPVANQSLPALERIAERYRDRGAIFYWVTLDSDKVRNKRYVSDTDL